MIPNVIDATEITTGDRQRKEFKEKELHDLAESIKRVGLIHAPVIQAGSNTLIAGERRLRALALVGGQFQYGDEYFVYPTIPVHTIDRDDPKLLFEIELEENLRRVNLTAMEEAAAIAKLHKIRLEANPKQTIKQTTEEVTQLQGKEKKNWDETRVADSILVDQFKDDPEVQRAAKDSLRKAAKVAKKKMEVALIRALSDKDEKTNPMFNVFCGDAQEILGGFSESTFDILLFDPPYGVNAENFGEQANALGHQYEDSFETAQDFLIQVLYYSKTFLKPQAHVLMFCSFELWQQWKKIYENDGFEVWPRPLIWSKGNQAHVPRPDYGPRYSYECILFATRGGRKINTLINDVLPFPPPRDKVHAAEKPAELLSTLIEFVARPGDKILDPCCGSGSIFLGARGKEVYVTGIEIDPNAFAVAKERAK